MRQYRTATGRASDAYHWYDIPPPYVAPPPAAIEFVPVAEAAPLVVLVDRYSEPLTLMF